MERAGQDRVERRLAAEVGSYSPMIEADEEGTLEIEHSRQIAGLMHKTQDNWRLCLSVVNHEIRKAAQGPKPVSLRREVQSYPPEFGSCL